MATRLGLSCAAVALAVAATACGSSNPAYCSNRTNLENSVKKLTSLDASGLRSQLTTIQNDASKLVSSAKSDFPNESSALQSSVSALAGTVKAFPSSPSAADIATAARDAAGVVTAVKNFTNATSSKCD